MTFIIISFILKNEFKRIFENYNIITKSSQCLNIDNNSYSTSRFNSSFFRSYWHNCLVLLWNVYLTVLLTLPNVTFHIQSLNGSMISYEALIENKLENYSIDFYCDYLRVCTIGFGRRYNRVQEFPGNHDRSWSLYKHV